MYVCLRGNHRVHHHLHSSITQSHQMSPGTTKSHRQVPPGTTIIQKLGNIPRFPNILGSALVALTLCWETFLNSHVLHARTQATVLPTVVLEAVYLLT